jgi:hypothetical protein
VANIVTIQPDIFIRAIFSQSIENVQLLIDNGIDLNKYRKYPFKTYSSPLILSYYCNNIEIFNLLIQNQFIIDDYYDIFYDPKYYKDFKFSVYLHFLKQKNYSVLNSLKFDEFQFITSFNLYQYLKTREEISKFYKSLFDIGFLIDFKSNVHQYFFSNTTNNKKPYIYNQLLPCINQNGISSDTIMQLIEFLNSAYKSHSFRTQHYLVTVLYEIILIFHQYSYRFGSPKLKPKEFITILSTILPLINEKYLKELISGYRLNLNFIMNGFLKEVTDLNYYFVMQESFMYSNIYNTNCFKMIDIFVKYKLISNNSFVRFLKKIISIQCKIQRRSIKI